MTKPDFNWNQAYADDRVACELLDADILAVLSDLPVGRALDLGCGSGALVAFLARRGLHVTGVDIAPNAIAQARRRLDADSLEADLVVADTSSWTPDGDFDLIVSSFALPQHRAGQSQCFAMAAAALAPAGHVVLKDFDDSMGWVSEFADFHLPTLEEVTEAFSSLRVLSANVVDTPAHHQGLEASSPAKPWTALFFHAQRDPKGAQ